MSRDFGGDGRRAPAERPPHLSPGSLQLQGTRRGSVVMCAMRWGSGLLVFLFVFFCLWMSVFPRAICGTDGLFPTDSPSAFLKDQPARARATSGLCVLERRVRPLSRGTRH